VPTATRDWCSIKLRPQPSTRQQAHEQGQGLHKVVLLNFPVETFDAEQGCVWNATYRTDSADRSCEALRFDQHHQGRVVRMQKAKLWQPWLKAPMIWMGASAGCVKGRKYASPHLISPDE